LCEIEQLPEARRDNPDIAGFHYGRHTREHARRRGFDRRTGHRRSGARRRQDCRQGFRPEVLSRGHRPRLRIGQVFLDRRADLGERFARVLRNVGECDMRIGISRVAF